jgi:hypothetical protein
MTETRDDDDAERRIARFLFILVPLLLAMAGLGFAFWGLPALAMIGLGATLLVFGMLAAYAAGF